MKAFKPMFMRLREAGDIFSSRQESSTPRPPSRAGGPRKRADSMSSAIGPSPPQVQIAGTLPLVGLSPFARLYRSGSRARRGSVGDAALLLVPPIHTLPFEIVAQILYECAHDDPSFAIRASHIDNRLRRISLACPFLWSNIRLSGANALNKARAYLQRSASVPVDIFLRYTSDKVPDVLLYVAHVNEFRRIFKELLVHVHRWRSLRLDIRDCNIMSYALRTCPKDAPILESVILRCRTAPPAADRGDGISLFEHGTPPNLKHVDLDAIATRWDCLVFRDLETLRIVRSIRVLSELTAEHLFTVLKASPRLRRLHLEHMTNTSQMEQALYRGTIDLRYMDTLILRKINPLLLAQIFSTIRVPNLHTLELQFTSSRRNVILIDSIATGTFALPNLVMFGLYYCDLPTDMVCSVLQRMNTLRGLRVVGGALALPLLQALCTPFRGDRRQSTWLCPELEVIQMKACGQVTGNDIVGLVKARYRNGSTAGIRNVHILSCDFVDDGIIKELAALKASAFFLNK